MYLMTDKAFKTVTRYAAVLAFSSPGTFGVSKSRYFLIPGLVKSGDDLVPGPLVSVGPVPSCSVLSGTFPGRESLAAITTMLAMTQGI